MSPSDVIGGAAAGSLAVGFVLLLVAFFLETCFGFNFQRAAEIGMKSGAVLILASIVLAISGLAVP